MASSSVEVASKALLLLGEPAIASLDDDSDIAAICKNIYELVIANLMGGHRWNFARTQVRLTQDTDAPDHGYTYAYTLPAELKGVPDAVYENADIGTPPTKEWKIFGRRIYTEHTSLYLDYQERKAESDWPDYFVTLAVYALAAHLAEPVTEDRTKTQLWMGKAFGTPGEGGVGGQFAVARNRDSTGSPSDAMMDFALIDFRG